MTVSYLKGHNDTNMQRLPLASHLAEISNTFIADLTEHAKHGMITTVVSPSNDGSTLNITMGAENSPTFISMTNGHADIIELTATRNTHKGKSEIIRVAPVKNVIEVLRKIINSKGTFTYHPNCIAELLEKQNELATAQS